MRRISTRKFIVTSAVTLGAVVGAAGITAAATNSASSSVDSSDSPSTAGDQSQDPSYKSSIAVPNNTKLDGLAKVTPEAATAAAAAAGGTAGTPQLENENGNLVYGVEVTKADGTKVDVKIDAGNGAVLAKEAADDHESASSSDTSNG